MVGPLRGSPVLPSAPLFVSLVRRVPERRRVGDRRPDRDRLVRASHDRRLLRADRVGLTGVVTHTGDTKRVRAFTPLLHDPPVYTDGGRAEAPRPLGAVPPPR